MLLLRLLAVLLLLGLAQPSGSEAIRSFDADVQLQAEADAFVVMEHILYDFGAVQRHGIFRDIPVRYGRGRSADYRIGLDVLSVTNGSGVARPFKVQRRGDNLRIRIGDAKRTVSGEQEYWIRYQVKRGILYFDDHDELYWNVTGTQWPVPIEAVAARVGLPAGAQPARVQLACFTGRRGSIEQACAFHQAGAEATFRASRGLGAGEGLTLVLGLPKGVLVQPSAWQRWLSRASDYLGPLSLLPLLVLGIMLWLWRSQGRDRGAHHAIAVRYEPPEGLTPAEVGTVVDERIQMADITSSILDLAVRGFLRIEELEAKRFLFLSHTDWRLVKLRPTEGLRHHERLMMEKLFSGREAVKVSELKNEFYRHLPAIRKALYAQVSKAEKLFPTSPESVRRRWRIVGILVLAVAISLSVFLGAGLQHSIPLGLCGVLFLAFAGAMPRRTRKGRAAYEEILGFKEFMERVDRDRLERSSGRDAGRFERVLPYAVVLGVADTWADAFADIYTEPPAWYTGHNVQHFRPQRFVSDLGRSLDTLGQAMRTQPQGGSGSSGMGGGGFSGGGFGGGGGGSW